MRFLFLTLSTLLVMHHVAESIMVSTVYAGKKKFKSISLGIPLIPTLVKVKPNKLHMTFRNNRYIRPPKFKVEGSVPLKVPTLIMPKPDPYAKPNIKDININLNLDGGGNKKGYTNDDYSASATEEQPQLLGGMLPGLLKTAAKVLPTVLNSISFQRRSMNLQEPYHHHLNINSPSNQNIRFRSSKFPERFISIPPNGQRPIQLPVKESRIAVEEAPVESQKFMETSPVTNSGDVFVGQESQTQTEFQGENEESVPMKINIGEHYDPNVMYMDENIVPTFDENDPTVEESQQTQFYNYRQYGVNGPSNGGNKGDYKDDSGPDDFRLDFSLSGMHGGPMIPYGTGNVIEKFYKNMNKFENAIPVGLPKDQVAKYYRAHSFNGGYIRPGIKVKESKLMKLLFG